MGLLQLPEQSTSILSHLHFASCRRLAYSSHHSHLRFRLGVDEIVRFDAFLSPRKKLLSTWAQIFTHALLGWIGQLIAISQLGRLRTCHLHTRPETDPTGANRPTGQTWRAPGHLPFTIFEYICSSPAQRILQLFITDRKSAVAKPFRLLLFRGFALRFNCSCIWWKASQS